MTLRELLIERRGALCQRWLDYVLDEYGAQAAARWRREHDPFANPVGHALRTGLPEILGAVAGGFEPAGGAMAALEAIVRIRSVQELAPSRAAGFAYKLRDAIRDELAAELAGGAHDGELAAVDRRIEQLVLLAFDAYVRAREDVFRLRQDELRRSVGSLLRRWHGGELPGPAPDVAWPAPGGPGARR